MHFADWEKNEVISIFFWLEERHLRHQVRSKEGRVKLALLKGSIRSALYLASLGLVKWHPKVYSIFPCIRELTRNNFPHFSGVCGYD